MGDDWWGGGHQTLRNALIAVLLTPHQIVSHDHKPWLILQNQVGNVAARGRARLSYMLLNVVCLCNDM